MIDTMQSGKILAKVVYDPYRTMDVYYVQFDGDDSPIRDTVFERAIVELFETQLRVDDGEWVADLDLTQSSRPSLKQTRKIRRERGIVRFQCLCGEEPQGDCRQCRGTGWC